ncbi:MAG TPA: hypothetical protein VJN95_04295, partial [Gemmatimonadales bacterium]|nr:hypothetical protein [Gemmatimonadales bacterium]
MEDLPGLREWVFLRDGMRSGKGPTAPLYFPRPHRMDPMLRWLLAFLHLLAFGIGFGSIVIRAQALS